MFVRVPEPTIAGLEREGFRFDRWDGAPLLRLATSRNTQSQAVDAFPAAAKRLLAADPARLQTDFTGSARRPRARGADRPLLPSATGVSGLAACNCR